MKKRVEIEQESAGVSQESRRDFLAKAGAFAAYTPPTMLALMLPSAEAVASGGRNTNPKDKKDKKDKKGKKEKKGKIWRRIKKIRSKNRRRIKKIRYKKRKQMKKRRG